MKTSLIFIKARRESLAVGYHPKRKRVCLSIVMEDERKLYKIASFQNLDSAMLFVQTMGKMLGRSEEEAKDVIDGFRKGEDKEQNDEQTNI